nr:MULTISPECIES: thioredoxin domain-containing protein [unclassified Corynebacterium]
MIDTVAFSSTWDGAAITLKGQGADDATPVADLYEDFSCPHCATLAAADRQSMREAVDNGDLVVKIHPLVFMDNHNHDKEMSDEEKDGNSHRGLAAALAAAASEQQGLYWNLRNHIFENQTEIYSTTWDNEKYAEAAKELGAPEKTVEAIREGSYTDKADEVGAKNAADLEKTEDGVSSPRLFINGEEKKLTGNSDWVAEYKRK